MRRPLQLLTRTSLCAALGATLACADDDADGGADEFDGSASLGTSSSTGGTGETGSSSGTRIATAIARSNRSRSRSPWTTRRIPAIS